MHALSSSSCAAGKNGSVEMEELRRRALRLSISSAVETHGEALLFCRLVPYSQRRSSGRRGASVSLQPFGLKQRAFDQVCQRVRISLIFMRKLEIEIKYSLRFN